MEQFSQWLQVNGGRIFLVVGAMNLLGFLSMGIDKRFAMAHKRRIPERTLMNIATFFGSLGVLVGMTTFHHKTKKIKFTFGVPCLLVLQIGILGYFLML